MSGWAPSSARPRWSRWRGSWPARGRTRRPDPRRRGRRPGPRTRSGSASPPCPRNSFPGSGTGCRRRPPPPSRSRAGRAEVPRRSPSRSSASGSWTRWRPGARRTTSRARCGWTGPWTPPRWSARSAPWCAATRRCAPCSPRAPPGRCRPSSRRCGCRWKRRTWARSRRRRARPRPRACCGARCGAPSTWPRGLCSGRSWSASRPTGTCSCWWRTTWSPTGGRCG